VLVVPAALVNVQIRETTPLYPGLDIQIELEAVVTVALAVTSTAVTRKSSYTVF
jgi:hypothetical protein